MNAGPSRWRPLYRWPMTLLVILGLWCALLVLSLASSWWDSRALDRAGVRVEATVIEADDTSATVNFVAPSTGGPTVEQVDVWGEDLDLRQGGTVTVLVDADDPSRLKVAGDHEPVVLTAALVGLAPLTFPAMLLALRGRHARRAERLAASDAPTFVVYGELRCRARWLTGRPRTELRLYALDEPPGVGRPLTVVPLLHEPSMPTWHGPLLLEAKGQLRELGLVVASLHGRVLWPAGPARKPRRHTELRGHPQAWAPTTA